MAVFCRTCLFQLVNGQKYPIEQTLQACASSTEWNNHSSILQLRKMIEKCIPEMDLDICDSSVICEDCYKLLMSAYKFKTICLQTEEKIYQYIERNNLRLGESIDLMNLFTKNNEIKTEYENDVKQEGNDLDEYGDMPNLLPEISLIESDCEVIFEESSVCEQEKCSKKNKARSKSVNNSQSISSLKTNCNILTEPSNVNESNKQSKRKVQDKGNTLNNSQSESDTCSQNSSISKNNESKKRARRKLQGKGKTLNNSDSEYATTLDDENDNTIRKGNSKYGKRPFTCHKCQYKGSKLELLKKHLNLKCGIKDPSKFKCDKCPYKTIRQRHLKRHQLTHGGPKPWVCGICQKDFLEKTFLKYHMFKHRPKKLLPFKCQEDGCNYAATRNCDLTAHKLIHMKEYPLFCKKCIKISFPSKEELLEHEKRCPGNSKKKNNTLT